MASVFRIFKSDFEPPATFENVATPPPDMADPEQFDRDVDAAFEKVQKRLEESRDGAAEDASAG
jgi:hypothetical protein